MGREPLWFKLLHLTGRRSTSAPVAEAETGLSPPTSVATPSALESHLKEIETLALKLYAAHGLPTQFGQYAQSPGNPQWKFIGKSLTADERWALMLKIGSTKGWRFGSLEELGGHDHNALPILAQASEMLSTCRRLRQSVGAGEGALRAEDVESALRLGANAKQIEWMIARESEGSLKLGKIDAPAKGGRRGGKSGSPAPAG